ncbi:DUF4229 domain-containing protein [Arthrobacter sp. D1-29]
MAFLKYSLIRLALFAPLFLLFYFLGLGALMSVVCAALIAFAVSYLFFQKQRDEAAMALQHRFSGKAKPLRSAGEVEDAAAEDSVLDANPDAVIRTDATDPRPASPAQNSRAKDSRPKGLHNS